MHSSSMSTLRRPSSDFEMQLRNTSNEFHFARSDLYESLSPWSLSPLGDMYRKWCMNTRMNWYINIPAVIHDADERHINILTGMTYAMSAFALSIAAAVAKKNTE